MLYVGAREALFALSLSDISKSKLQKNVSVWKDELLLANVQDSSFKHVCSWHLETNLSNALSQHCGFNTRKMQN